MLKLYSEDTDTGGTHNLKENDTQAHIQIYYSVCLFVCMLLFVCFLRVQRRTLTWLTWPHHPWEESMWEQPAPWLQTFLQWPAATATGWWLHPAMWEKTSPPPPPLSSVSQTGTSLVITQLGFLFFVRFFVSFSLCLSFFLSFFSLFCPRQGTVPTVELACCWFLVEYTAIKRLLIDKKQSVWEVQV